MPPAESGPPGDTGFVGLRGDESEHALPCGGRRFRGVQNTTQQKAQTVIHGIGLLVSGVAFHAFHWHGQAFMAVELRHSKQRVLGTKEYLCHLWKSHWSDGWDLDRDRTFQNSGKFCGILSPLPACRNVQATYVHCCRLGERSRRGRL